MKHVKVRSLGDLLMTSQIWRMENGNIEHEEHGGTITTDMLGKEYVINIEHNLIVHDDDYFETISIYHKLTGSVPHKKLLYGWMFNDLGKYVPSIDEIINSM